MSTLIIIPIIWFLHIYFTNFYWFYTLIFQFPGHLIFIRVSSPKIILWSHFDQFFIILFLFLFFLQHTPCNESQMSSSALLISCSNKSCPIITLPIVLNRFPYRGFVKKSTNMNFVGKYSSYMISCFKWSPIQKNLILICLDYLHANLIPVFNNWLSYLRPLASILYP